MLAADIAPSISDEGLGETKIRRCPVADVRQPAVIQIVSERRRRATPALQGLSSVRLPSAGLVAALDVVETEVHALSEVHRERARRLAEQQAKARRG